MFLFSFASLLPAHLLPPSLLSHSIKQYLKPLVCLMSESKSHLCSLKLELFFFSVNHSIPRLHVAPCAELGHFFLESSQIHANSVGSDSYSPLSFMCHRFPSPPTVSHFNCESKLSVARGVIRCGHGESLAIWPLLSDTFG